MIQCPVCKRKFGLKAADRHIEFCKKQSKLKKEKVYLEQGKVIISDHENSSLNGSIIITNPHQTPKSSSKKRKNLQTTRAKTMYKLSRQYEQTSPTRNQLSKHQISNLYGSKHSFNNSASRQTTGAKTERVSKLPQLQADEMDLPPVHLYIEQPEKGNKTQRGEENEDSGLLIDQILQNNSVIEKNEVVLNTRTRRDKNDRRMWLKDNFFSNYNTTNQKDEDREKEGIKPIEQQIMSEIQSSTRFNQKMALNYETITHLSHPESLSSLQVQLQAMPSTDLGMAMIVGQGLDGRDKLLTPQLSTPGKQSKISNQLFSKFCTQCGMRFQTDLDRFCGGCGNKRKYDE